MSWNRFRAEAAETSPAPLQDLLARAGQHVARFWDQFSAVTCIETIEQKKLSDDGKVLVKKHSAYDYLVLLQLSGDDMIVDESRVLQGKPGKECDRALLATSGFSTLLLIFHPRFRPSYAFTDEGDDPQTPQLHRVRFEHVRGKRSPSVLQLRSREYPLEWQGTAWVESTTGSYHAYPGGSQGTARGCGVSCRLDSEVQYAPVSLNGTRRAALDAGHGANRSRYEAPALAQPASVHRVQAILRHHRFQDGSAQGGFKAIAMASVPSTTTSFPTFRFDAEWRHSARLYLAWTLMLIVIVAVAYFGFPYYRLGMAERAYSPLRPMFRPSGSVGLQLGILRARIVSSVVSLSDTQALALAGANRENETLARFPRAAWNHGANRGHPAFFLQAQRPGRRGLLDHDGGCARAASLAAISTPRFRAA